MRIWRMAVFAVAVALAVGALPAFADQISIGGDGIAYFCTNGAGQPIWMSTSAACAVQPVSFWGSNASFEHPPGFPIIPNIPWLLTFPNGFQLDNYAGGVFTTNSVPTPFVWDGPWGIAGNIVWRLVKDDTSTPQFVGSMTVTFNGSPNKWVKQAFPVGFGMPAVDFTMYLDGRPTLDDLWNGTATKTWGRFSSGEIVGVPEPVTALLLGVALLGLVKFMKRRPA